MLRTDSATHDGTDSVYWYKPELSSVSGTGICGSDTLMCLGQRTDPTLMGLVSKAHDRYLQYQNTGGELITFDMNLAPGDSLIVYENMGERLRIKLISAISTNVLGFPDSVLNFQFIHTNLADVPIPGTLNGSTLTFSKACGMLSGYAMKNFPAVLQPITLEGIRGLNRGFYGITYASAYDFAPGDEYELYQHGGGSGGYPLKNDHSHYRVLSRTDFTDHVEYVSREDTKKYFSGVPYLYHTDTITSSHYKIYVDVQPLESGPVNIYDGGSYHYRDSLLGCYGPFYTYETSLNPIYIECSGCYAATTYLGQPYYSGIQYATKAGLTSITSSTFTSPGATYYTNINYVKTGGKECSSAVLDSYISNNSIAENSLNNLVKIYPNPSSNKVVIESEKNNISSVEIVDITGKKLQVITNTGTVMTMDVTGFLPGTYWLNINTGNVLLTKKLVIIH